MIVMVHRCVGSLVRFDAPLGLLLAAALVTGGCKNDPEPITFDCVAQTGSAGSGARLAIDVGATGEGDGGDGGEDDGGGGPAEGFVGDGPYDAGRGFGWLGEAEVLSKDSWYIDAFHIGTHGPENPWSDWTGYHVRAQPYLSSIQGHSGYRVDAPDGTYRVTLMFSELLFPEPGLRVFDVSANGEVLLGGLDLAGLADQDEPVEIAIQVEARDGRIELAFDNKTDEPAVLAGLVVELAVAGAGGAVQGLESRAGAGEALLRWDRPAEPVRGWLVTRSVDGGDHQATSSTLSAVPYSIEQRDPGEKLDYRVHPVGADCSLGDPVDSDPITVRSASDFGLPVIDVTVATSDFSSIHRDPSEQLEVPCSVTSDGETASGTIRLRGQSTRWIPKRSFRIGLDEGTIDGRDRLKLLAEQSAASRLWQLSAYGLFERMGGVASAARPVLLRINGEVYGVYDDIEHVGDDFLTSRGYGIDDRFRIRFTDFGLTADGQPDLEGFEKKENEGDPSPELEQLLIWLNTVAEHQFEAELDGMIDRQVFLDYVAGQILVANWEIVDGGHYLILDPATGAFLFVPWDLNNDSWTTPEYPLASYTVYSMGWGFQYWPWSRAFNSPSFRGDLIQRLEELLQDEFGTAMDDAVDQVEEEIAAALLIEPYVWRRRYEEWVGSLAQEMHTFVADRRDFVSGGLADLAQLGETGLVLTEVGGGAAGTFEIENRSAGEIGLEGCYLTTALDEPSMIPLAGSGGVESGQRLVVETDVSTVDGGYVVLFCGIGGEGEGDEGDEGGEGLGASSLVFYPPLAAGEAYLRSAGSWSVGEPSPGT